MAVFGSIKRNDLVRTLKQAGFDGPHAGGKHEFMVKGNLRLTLPNPH
jgi:predicted RNA binding protein YcfA (HicA-like mRNA interferase family)